MVQNITFSQVSGLDFVSEDKHILNTELTLLTPVDHNIQLFKRYLLLRYYFIKSYKGRCYLLGKPANGQRTWSNAWNSYRISKDVRTYVHTLFRNKSNLQIKTKQKIALRREKINRYNWF